VTPSTRKSRVLQIHFYRSQVSLKAAEAIEGPFRPRDSGTTLTGSILPFMPGKRPLIG
jgi:hypothetical protein